MIMGMHDRDLLKNDNAKQSGGERQIWSISTAATICEESPEEKGGFVGSAWQFNFQLWYWPARTNWAKAIAQQCRKLSLASVCSSSLQAAMLFLGRLGLCERRQNFGGSWNDYLHSCYWNDSIAL
jgi:hypothetical protein